MDARHADAAVRSEYKNARNGAPITIRSIDIGKFVVWLCDERETQQAWYLIEIWRDTGSRGAFATAADLLRYDELILDESIGTGAKLGPSSRKDSMLTRQDQAPDAGRSGIFEAEFREIQLTWRKRFFYSLTARVIMALVRKERHAVHAGN